MNPKDKPFAVEMLKVSDLKIDYSYQRTPSEKTVLAIRDAFTWLYFGVITVAIREDGSLWICDGSHRVNALIRLGIEEVPCVVFQSSGSRFEAEYFLELNARRNAVHVVDKFKAEVESGTPLAKKAKQLLEDSGYEATKNTIAGGCSCVVALMKAIALDEPRAAIAFDCAVKIANGAGISNPLFLPLFYAERRLIKSRRSITESRVMAALCEAGASRLPGIMQLEALKLAGNTSGWEKRAEGLLNWLVGEKKRLPYAVLA